MIQDYFDKINALLNCPHENQATSPAAATCGGWSAAAQQALNTKLTAAVQQIPTDYEAAKLIARGVGDCLTARSSFTGNLGGTITQSAGDADSVDPWPGAGGTTA